MLVVEMFLLWSVEFVWERYAPNLAFFIRDDIELALSYFIKWRINLFANSKKGKEFILNLKILWLSRSVYHLVLYRSIFMYSCLSIVTLSYSNVLMHLDIVVSMYFDAIICCSFKNFNYHVNKLMSSFQMSLLGWSMMNLASYPCLLLIVTL